MEQTMWTMEVAEAKVQSWYDKLGAAINPYNATAITKLYNVNSVLYARKRKKAYIGPQAIERFWKSQHLGDVKFEIQIRALYPIEPPVRRGRRLILQGAYWTGVLSAKGGGRAKAKISLAFCGGGGHIDPCDFGNPDFEIYPF